MKVFVVTIIILFNICFTQRTEMDSLNTQQRAIGFDKIQHTVVSCLITISSQYIMENKLGFDENNALYYSVSSATMVGVAKELNDAQSKERKFDRGDLIANGVGIAIAIFIITN